MTKFESEVFEFW